MQTVMSWREHYTIAKDVKTGSKLSTNYPWAQGMLWGLNVEIPTQQIPTELSEKALLQNLPSAQE